MTGCGSADAKHEQRAQQHNDTREGCESHVKPVRGMGHETLSAAHPTQIVNTFGLQGQTGAAPCGRCDTGRQWISSNKSPNEQPFVSCLLAHRLGDLAGPEPVGRGAPPTTPLSSSSLSSPWLASFSYSLMETFS